jgi:branched-chain amino acid transport system substrate-binding protein
MNARKAALVILSGAALAGAGCGGDDAHPASAGGKEPLRIGAMFDLTGPFAGVGVSEKQAFELAVKHLNDTGGINGRPLEASIEDSQTSPDAAVKITRQFIRDRVPVVVGPTPTQLCDPASRIAEAAGMAMVCITPFPEATTPHIFLVDKPRVELVGDLPASYFAKRGWKRVACLHTADAGGEGYADAIAQAASKQGLSVVAQESYQQGDSDLSAQLTKVRATNPDVIYSCASGTNLIPLLKGMKQLGMSQPVFAGHASVSYEVAKLARDTLPAAGLYSDASPVLVPDQTPDDFPGKENAAQYAKAYENGFGGQKPNTVSGYVADSVGIIAKALANVSKIDGTSVAKAVERVCHFEGVLADYCFSAKDHRGFRATRSMIVRWTPQGTFKVADMVDLGG